MGREMAGAASCRAARRGERSRTTAPELVTSVNRSARDAMDPAIGRR
jgi:hypothetical protein